MSDLVVHGRGRGVTYRWLGLLTRGVVVALSGSVLAVPAPSMASAPSHVPGTFVVSLKVMLPGTTPSDERQGARLAIYSFRDPSSDPGFMTFRMDWWGWDTRTPDSDIIADCQAGSLIGHVIDGSEPNAADADKSPQCPAKGLQEPHQRFGTYCGPNAADPNSIRPDDVFTIYWHDTPGNTTPGCGGPYYERWRYSPRILDGGRLAMIEMLAASNVDQRYPFYAASSPYNPAALSVGWGFGAQNNVGQRGGETIDQIAEHFLTEGVVYEGYWKSWNNWCTIPDRRNESVRRVNTAARVYPWKKTDGTFAGGPSPKLRVRDRTRTPSQTHDVYSYVSVPDNQESSFTDRRINVSSGNDYDDNGHIADNFGHTQSGLQIINAYGAMVGFVSVEVGRGNKALNGRDTLSALYYLRSDLTPNDPVGAVIC